MSQPTSEPTAAFGSRDVRKRFGAIEVTRGVSLTVDKGERHALIGPNGAGKSTTFNLISGRFPISSGSVRLNDEEISGLTPFEINRKGLSRNSRVTNIFHRLPVFEDPRCAVLWSLGCKCSFWHKLAGLRDAHERAEEVLGQIGVTHRREATAGLLTYTGQRALKIGITIAGGTDVILLGEPTVGMSRSESDHAVKLIRKVMVDRTLVMVEHDTSVVFGLADRISVLVRGEVIATDTPEAIHNDRRVKEAYLDTALDELVRAY